jgi:hypothetical protein
MSNRDIYYKLFSFNENQISDNNVWPVKGMQLVMELEQDLKVANVICMVLSRKTLSLQT